MIGALVIKGYGIDCEKEMGVVCLKGGAIPTLVLMSSLPHNDGLKFFQNAVSDAQRSCE